MKKIPEIRFPEFSGEWIEKRLGEVGNLKYGKGQNEITNLKGNYPIIGTGGILNYSGDYLYDKESVIIGRKGTIDKPTYINKPFWCVDTTFYIEFFYKYYPKFIYYLLTQINWKIYNESTGVPSLSSNTIKKIKIHISPTLEEQQKIAEFLSSVDEKIEIVAKKIEELKKYKKGLLQKLLNVKKGEPELRFKGFSGKWVEKKLGEVCNNITTGKLDANAMVENGKYKFFTCAKEVYLINEYSFDDEAILISGNGANVGYIHYFKGKFNAYQRTYVLTNFNVNIFYVKFFLETFLKRHINKEKNEGNTPYIKLSTLTNFKLYLPPTLAEQEKIAEFLSSIDEKIELNEKRLKALKNYKQGLLQKMFV